MRTSTTVTLCLLLGAFFSLCAWAQNSTIPQAVDETAAQPLDIRYVRFLPESEFPIIQRFRVLDKISKKSDQVNLIVNVSLTTESDTARTIELSADYVLGNSYTKMYAKFNALDFSTDCSYINTNPISNLLSLRTDYSFDKAKISWKSEQFEQYRNVSAPKRAVDHNSLFYLARCLDPDQLSQPAYLIVVYSQKNNTFVTQVKFEGVQSVWEKDDSNLFSVNYGEFTEYYWIQKDSPWNLLKATTELEEWTAMP